MIHVDYLMEFCESFDRWIIHFQKIKFNYNIYREQYNHFILTGYAPSINGLNVIMSELITKS